MKRYLIPGSASSTSRPTCRSCPARTARARVVGTAKAWVRRLDNSFFASLTGGLPRLTTDLERGNDGIVHFTNLQLYSPKLRLSGRGIAASDGTFHIEARGRQAQYGPLQADRSTAISSGRGSTVPRPPERGARHPRHAAAARSRSRRLRLSRQRRLAARAVHQQRPDPAAQGRARDDRDRRARRRRRARERRLRSDPGGFTGTLALAGGGLGGTLDFRAGRRRQRIEAHLTANNVSFPGPPPIACAAGRLDGTIILADGRTTHRRRGRRARARGGGITLARLTANAKLVNGAGRSARRFAGRAARVRVHDRWPNVAPDRISLTGSGRVERRPLTLDSPRC
jgi:translocation and assembly module TamB